ncbi:MAG: helix-turn-helix transcriptional regulator [Deferrisomatales bacterium]|nr:helix-turn-helix transcriptional regulator [Deferrisomatales bacterium]
MREDITLSDLSPAELLRRARQATHQSVAEIASSVGVDEETWLLYESGNRIPDGATIEVVINIYNRSPERVGARLQELRKRWGYPQSEMAAVCCVGYRTWQGYEKGERLPNAEVIQQLVDIEANANWILNGVGSPELKGELEETVSKSRLIHTINFTENHLLKHNIVLPTNTKAELFVTLYEIARKSENGLIDKITVENIVRLIGK